MYGIPYSSNSLAFSLQGTDDLFFIPVGKTCAFYTSLHIKREQEQEGECLLAYLFQKYCLVILYHYTHFV